MTDISKTLHTIEAELQALRVEEHSTAVTKTMTFDEFIAYVQEQTALVKSDSDPKPRIEALIKVVALAKMENWEEGSTAAFPIFSGPESVQAQSANAERNAGDDGQSLGMPPGPQAAPSGAAFESASGPTGPATNTAAPASRAMPPVPGAQPTGAGGFMAKAREVLGKSAEGQALLSEFASFLDSAPAEGVTFDDDAKAPVAKDAGWPDDLANEHFLNEQAAPEDADNFGTDPDGLSRFG